MTLLLFGFGPTVATTSETNAPSLWSAGIEWGTAETTGAIGYWQPATPAVRTGAPDLAIAVGGRRMIDNWQSATWALGRSDWLSTLAPNSASFTFVGTIDATINDPVVVGLMSETTTGWSPPLWVGRVDSINTSQDTAGNYWTTVSAVDNIGILGLARIGNDRHPVTVPGGTLDAILTDLAADAGIPITVETVDTLPTLLAATNVNTTLLEYANRMERSSNVLLFLLGNGHLAARQRKAMTGSVDIIPLTGLDGYSSWTEQLSTASVINKWSFTNEAGDLDQSSYTQDSIDAYGEHAYSVSDMLRDEHAYDALLIDNFVLTEPRAVMTGADFPIYDLSQKVLFIDPLDWVDHDGDTWQVMSVQHDASPGSWRMTMTADQTQNYLVNDSDPTPITEPFLDTQEITAVKDSTVVRFGGGTLAGGGGDEWLPVGLDSGDVYRSLIQFPINWPANFVRVHKATLHLRTSQTTRVSFGTDPRIIVRRVTNSWDEGGATWPLEDDNGVIWPGPGTHTAGQKNVHVTTSENEDVDIAVTEIAQGWHDDPDGNHGLRLAAVSETAHRYCTEFFSSDHATHGPTLTLVCVTTA